MPGYELVGKEEKDAILEIFEQSNGVMFAHGFDARRNHIFRVRNFEQAFAKKLNSPHALAVSSGTTALMTAIHALGIGPGDEVITQCFTFVATVEAILSVGATPILTEIDSSYNMDPRDLEAKITAKTKAIIPVHMAGSPARMAEIKSIAEKHHLPLIEDAAQAIGAKWKGSFLGTLGDFGTFSLDFGKTITTGEGGMILTNQASLHQKVLEFHDHGHEYNPSVGRAQDTRKNWGLNFRMSEMNAAFGLAQLKKLDFILEKSRQHAQHIQSHLSRISGLHWRELPEGGEDNGDALYLYFESEKDCLSALAAMQRDQLGTKNVPDAMKWHFAGEWEHIFGKSPHLSPSLKQNLNSWPRSADLLKRTIALPIMVNWTEEQLVQQTEKLVRALS